MLIDTICYLSQFLQSQTDNKTRMKRFMQKIYGLSRLSVKNEIIESVYLFEQKLAKVVQLFHYLLIFNLIKLITLFNLYFVYLT